MSNLIALIMGSFAPPWPQQEAQETQWWRTCLPKQETQEMQFESLGREDSLAWEGAPYSSIHTWNIPWTEEPGGSMGLERVRHDWALSTLQQTFWLSLLCSWVKVRDAARQTTLLGPSPTATENAGPNMSVVPRLRNPNPI